MDMERYARHTVLPEIGERNQSKLGKSCVAVFGLGALGSTMTDALARTGIGTLKIVDRDYVELSNLNHQVLYGESDIGVPKAEAAEERIEEINSEVDVKSEVLDIGLDNVEDLIDDVDLVLDGTDNMEVRYQINDACVKNGIPWIYTAVLGTYGMTLNIIPGKTACLRCLIPERPSAGSMETCESAGILFSLPRIMGNIAATEAVKFLVGESFRSDLLTLELWDFEVERTEIERRDGCKSCVEKRFESLESEGDMTTELCGRNAVQVTPSQEVDLDLEKFEQRFEDAERKGKKLLKIHLEKYSLNVFKDGRVIVEGTEDPKKARSLYSQYIGK